MLDYKKLGEVVDEFLHDEYGERDAVSSVSPETGESDWRHRGGAVPAVASGWRW